jgi:HSP20 family protein
VKEDDYCCERHYGKFYRAIALPTEVEAGKRSATYRNGVLEVHLPKAKTVRALVSRWEVRPVCFE